MDEEDDDPSRDVIAGPSSCDGSAFGGHGLNDAPSHHHRCLWMFGAFRCCCCCRRIVSCKEVVMPMMMMVDRLVRWFVFGFLVLFVAVVVVVVLFFVRRW